MHNQRGRSLPLSTTRRLICDLLYFARKVPSVPVQRQINISALVELREQMVHAPSWCAIFMKAYGLTAAAFPALRRAYLGFPRPHLYEHPSSIASVTIERRYGDEDAVFIAKLRSPETQDLHNLDFHLRRFKEDPVESIGLYRRALKVSRLPLPIRRLIWWIGLNSSGHKRAKRMGTFGVSVYSSLGAASLHPLSPLTTTINYGVIQKDGGVDVRVVYDHRVMDGATIARALAHLEEVLNGAILTELEECSDGQTTEFRHQIRNPKHEIRNKFKAQILKSKTIP